MITLLYLGFLIWTFYNRLPFLKRFFPRLSFWAMVNPFEPPWILWYALALALSLDVLVIIGLIGV